MDMDKELSRPESFIEKIEMIYIILMSWGFAQSVGAVLEKERWEFIPLLIINAFVLIRFFFAPEINLTYVIERIKDKKSEQRWVFFRDIPVLLLHSFFTMQCVMRLLKGLRILFILISIDGLCVFFLLILFGYIQFARGCPKVIKIKKIVFQSG